jgi:GNAT superfamily N-acetyltransferase
MPAGYIVREGFDAMDFARAQAWLSQTYWTPGISQDRIEHAARHSALVLGAFNEAGEQVGFARVVSDCARFAYLCDVIVDPVHRGKGIGRAMVTHALEHPSLATVLIWTLGTRDAHGVYEPLGFKPITDPASAPERWMVLRRGG